MAKDLQINASASTLLGSLFFLGYFFFQIPGAHYAAKKSAKTGVLVTDAFDTACSAAPFISENVSMRGIFSALRYFFPKYKSYPSKLISLLQSSK